MSSASVAGIRAISDQVVQFCPLTRLGSGDFIHRIASTWSENARIYFRDVRCIRGI